MKSTNCMIIATLFFAIILSVTACNRKIFVPVHTTRTIIDTIVQNRVDSALLDAVFECDSVNNVLIKKMKYSKSQSATQVFEFQDNNLKIKTQWRTKIVDRIVEIKDTVTVIQTLKVDKIIYKTHSFFWVCFAIALMSVILLIIRLLRVF